MSTAESSTEITGATETSAATEAPGERQAPQRGERKAPQRGERKVRQGVVVSDKMDKTVVVLVERRTTHPLYAKTLTKSEKYHAHDETNDVNTGDRVRIVETRPLSKTKRWRVLDVVERAK
jgi:small subunit ribosomal protein S17